MYQDRALHITYYEGFMKGMYQDGTFRNVPRQSIANTYLKGFMKGMYQDGNLRNVPRQSITYYIFVVYHCLLFNSFLI